ncbi:unnamed protein product [Closterium sp. NIES-54]
MWCAKAWPRLLRSPKHHTCIHHTSARAHTHTSCTNLRCSSFSSNPPFPAPSPSASPTCALSPPSTLSANRYACVSSNLCKHS